MYTEIIGNCRVKQRTPNKLKARPGQSRHRPGPQPHTLASGQVCASVCEWVCWELVNISVESHSSGGSNSSPSASPNRNALSHPKSKSTSTENWKREINLYINCVKWICL